MKKLISLLLVNLLIVTNIACFNKQQIPSTITTITNQDPDSSVLTSVGDAGVVGTLPPLPEPEPMRLQPPEDSGALIQALRTGQTARWNGVIFNGPAVAFLEVEFRAVQQRCMIDRRRETEEVIARYQAHLEQVQTSLDASNQMHRIIVEGRDSQIADLNRIINEQRDASTITPLQTVLYIGGGILVGAIITGATAYVLTR